MKISGSAAWQNVTSNSDARWNPDRFNPDVVKVANRPKFQLTRSATFFCIGSCFARNVEEHLIYQDIPVLSRKIICPREEWHARPNGIVNKFTTESMLNEARWVGTPHAASDCLVETNAGWIDLQLAGGVQPVSLERGIERRRYLETEYFRRILSSDIVIVTLGLTEIWQDERAGIYLNAAPSLWMVRREPERFSFSRTDVAANVAALEKLRALLRPAAKVVVTVSPVPLGTTFTTDDVLAANSYSKSTLRAAAQIFADAHDNVDYFPSYEMVMLSRRESTFAADVMHVNHAAVGSVVAAFLESYLGETQPIDARFDEKLYLLANPDVDDAVRRGELIAGFHHWRQVGHSEGRPLKP
jgi:hypothetical protein